MTPDDDVFSAALALSGSERTEFLAMACREDLAQRGRIEALLRAHQRADDAFRLPAAPRFSAVAEEKRGEMIGRYKLLEKIGEGGCGVVWMAEQEEPVRRRVALKVIKLGMDTKEVVARFEAERQALAMMDHPNIAKVFDAGTTPGGRPYFVMELVRGIPITRYSDEQNLSTQLRLQLFIQVCQAIQHAHQKGIIHRDIKPSNILVAQHDDVAVPKVIDFGIAKATQGRLTDATLFTAFTQFIGTPAYMSPEQAEFSGLDVDTRSDIYSLGVLLYELLAGRPPFDPKTLGQKGLDEIRRVIREVDPPRPSTRLSTLTDSDRTTVARLRATVPGQLSTILRGDLDWIVMKALEKNRTRRYDTANSLALDLQRHLRNEPVVARPPSTWYLLQKLIRRNRMAFAGCVAVILALVLGTVVSTRQAIRALRAEREQAQLRAEAEQAARRQAELRLRAEAGEQDARRANADLRRTTYVDEMNIAQQALTNSTLVRATQLLDRHRPKPGEEDLRGFEWRHLWGESRSDEEANLGVFRGGWGGMAVSPDGLLLASPMVATIEIRSLQTRALLTSLPVAGGANVLKFSPDGRWLMASSDNGLLRWRTDTWAAEPLLVTARAPFAFARGGTVLVAREERRLTLWSTESWSKLADLPGELKGFPPGQRNQAIAVSPDGSRVFFGADEATGIRCWDLEKGTEEATMKPAPAMIQALAMSRDGLLAAARFDGRITVWDIATRQVRLDYVAHHAWVTNVAFSPDGSLIASASYDQTIVVHDVLRPNGVRRLSGHRGAISALAFSPDGSGLISGSAFDRTLRLWAVRPREKRNLITGQVALAFMDSGRGLVCWSASEGFNRYDLATAHSSSLGFKPVPVQIPGTFYLYIGRISLAPNLSTLANVKDGQAEIWNLASGEKEIALKHEAGRITSLAFSPDGRRLATVGHGGEMRLWETSTWTSEVLPTQITTDGWQVTFSADGRFLAARFPRDASGPSLLVFDLSARTKPVKLQGPNSTYRLLFSADASLLYASQYDGSIRIYDLTAAKQVGALRGHPGTPVGLALSPDGRTLASCGDDHLVKLWNVASQQEILTLPSLRANSGALMFSPDGRWLAVDTVEDRVQLWHAPSWEEIARQESAR